MLKLSSIVDGAIGCAVKVCATVFSWALTGVVFVLIGVCGVAMMTVTEIIRHFRWAFLRKS